MATILKRMIKYVSFRNVDVHAECDFFCAELCIFTVETRTEQIENVCLTMKTISHNRPVIIRCLMFVYTQGTISQILSREFNQIQYVACSRPIDS